MKEEIKRFVILNTEKYIVQNKPFVLNGEAAVWNGKKFLFATIKEDEDDFEFKPESMIKNLVQQADFYQTAYLVVYDFYQYFQKQLFPDIEPEYEYIKYLIDKKMFYGAFVKTMLSVLQRPSRFSQRIIFTKSNREKSKEIFYNIINYEFARIKEDIDVNLLLANRYTFIFSLLFEIVYAYSQSKINNDESFYRKYLEKIFIIDLSRNKNEVQF